ncbi:MAG: SprT family zinc-dependent metalloprotease [Alphaproteobacteria bacterium]|jgi:predicted metal-dependent hydrolase
MNNIILEKDGQEILVLVRVSSRAKTIRLGINHNHEVELVLFRASQLRLGTEFVHKKIKWIFDKVNARKQDYIFLVSGAVIPILGKEYIIKHNAQLGGMTCLEGDMLVVSGLERHISIKVKKLLTQILLQEIKSYSELIAIRLGAQARKISIRDTTSRWGSCSKDGNVSFSFRLVFGPIDILRYVIVHEYCHLLVHDHSKKFWNLVESLCPGHKVFRHWLKKNGSSLFKYR